jgi:hypothetical protein
MHWGFQSPMLPCCHRTSAAHRHRTVRESLYNCSLDYCRFWSAKCTSDLADLGGTSLMHRIHFCVEGPMKRQEIPWLVSVKSSSFYHRTSHSSKSSRTAVRRNSTGISPLCRVELSCRVTSTVIFKPHYPYYSPPQKPSAALLP